MRITTTQAANRNQLIDEIYIWPFRVVGEVIRTFGQKFSWMASLMIVYEPLIRAWLAITAAAVAIKTPNNWKLAGMIAFIMYTLHRGRNIKNQFTRFVKIADYAQTIKDISHDESIQKFATNLVYITHADLKTDIETKILYSICNKKPKRADTYWFLHVHITDEPNTMEYSVDKIIPGVAMRVEFSLGFKVQPRINLYFKHVLQERVAKNEIVLKSG